MNETEVRKMFGRANFIQDLGIELDELSPGFCQTHMQIKEKHLQQTGVVHAGVVATLADHSAGGAVVVQLKENKYVLTVEFKINLLRPASGELLRCRSRALKVGRTLAIAESEVFSVQGNNEILVSKAIVTLAVLDYLSNTSQGT